MTNTEDMLVISSISEKEQLRVNKVTAFKFQWGGQENALLKKI